MMKLKEFFLSDAGVLIAGIVLTLVVLAESIFFPWSPYFPIYAILAIVVPLALGAYRFGSFRRVMASAGLLTLGIFLVDLIWDLGVWGWLYESLLARFGVASDPFYALDAAIEVMFEAVSRDLGITLDTAYLLFGLFVLVWAPVGEELFYRGYLYGALRRRHSFLAAASISAIFFGIRHAVHFFYLWPEIPLVSALAWALSTFGYGIYISYLYEKSRSLYPPIVEHLLINLVWLLLGS